MQVRAIMPIHEYFPLQGPGCALCCYGFERLHGAHEAPLSHCPACGTPLRRALSAPTILEGQAHVLRESHLARHGFVQYRRAEKGRYEKTAGDGPETIGGD